ncbi:935_t:CDS:2 [Racocetra fulgida]|uniref:935_t:CDS:1 n=1 Tax=Racocetra fulgida TaxID=60492 RepID=A0A9N9FMK3_9GLOM|nr:935_t:CDS:2 [Racocetra fulgida]
MRSQQNEVQQIYNIIPQIDSEFLSQIHQIIINVINHTKEEELVELMQNLKGKHKNEIISVYFQKKALEFITDSKCKSKIGKPKIIKE